MRLAPLDRKLLRDLWHLRGQLLAIALVIASGAAMFVMMLGAMDSLAETREAYYDRYRFGHVFASAKRAPISLEARIRRIPGVARAETRIVANVVLDVRDMREPARGRLVSVPERARPALNDLVLRAGRWVAPGRPMEAILSEAFAEAHGLGPGDSLAATLNGRKRRLDIVGVALSPEYVYSIGPGELVPDNRRFGIIWLGRETLEAAFDLDGAFNDVTLALEPRAIEAEVIDRLDILLEPYGGVGAYGRKDQVSDFYLSNELTQIGAMVKVAPPIFFGIAAFLLNVVLTRLIAVEREQIGLLKAFGYSNLAVGLHYLKLVIVVTAFGVLIGVGAGAWLGRGITRIYTDFFRFPLLYYRPDADVFVITILVSFAAAIAGTLTAVRRAAMLPPAVAMAPPVPTAYRRSRLELAAVARTFGQTTRMILRHIARWPVRAGLTMLGVAMSVAILIAAWFTLDSIEFVIEVYFHRQARQDMTVTLVEPRSERVVREIRNLPGVLAAEPYRAVSTRFTSAHRTRRSAITGLDPGADLGLLLDADLEPVRLPERGLILTAKLAELLGVGRGDRVMTEVMEDRRPTLDLPIVGIVESYIGTAAYMDRHTLNRHMREGPVVSGAHLMVDQAHADALYDRLKESPAIAGVASQRAALASFRETLAQNLELMISFNLVFAGLIAIGVVYNSARIALSERGREIATLRVLGFGKGEAAYILLGELGLLALAALPIGCLIGYGLAALMSMSFDTELYRVPLVIERATYGWASLFVLGTTVLSGLMVGRRVSELDLIAVLKTRE